MRSVVEIITPSESELLTTLDRVKRELNIANDASDEILEDKIAEASSDIAQAIPQRLPREDVRETFWHDEGAHHWHTPHHHGNPSQTTLFLRRTPAVKIDSVTVDDIAIDPSEFRLDPDAGLLDRVSSDGIPCAWFFCKSVVVAYAAGFILPGESGRNLPPAIEGAVVALVSDYWASRGRDPTLRAETIPGVIERQFWVGAVGDPAMLPPRVLASIDPFRRLAVAVA
jgi:Phage gp6-like head-tail connector protein